MVLYIYIYILNFLSSFLSCTLTEAFLDAHSYHAVAGADFNYDGKLDLLVSGHNNDVNNTYFLHIYFGNYETFGTLFPSMQWRESHDYTNTEGAQMFPHGRVNARCWHCCRRSAGDGC